jgi:hypothetical protein
MTAAEEAAVREAESFRARAALGDFSGGRDVLQALEGGTSPLSRALACAVRSQIGLMFPNAARLPDDDELARFIGENDAVRRAAALAARNFALAALLDLDPERLARSTHLLGRLVCDERGDIELTIANRWRQLLSGEPLAPGFEGTTARAAKLGHAAAVVETEVLRAIEALESSDLSDGLKLARRGSLMARSEGIPEAEFLANIVLARARRYCRQVHLSLIILEALDGVVTPRYKRWLSWESVLAGGRLRSLEDGPARELALLLEAAQQGDLASFSERSHSLSVRLGDGLFGREAADLIAAIAPDEKADRRELSAWRNGKADLVPPALHGMAVRVDEASGAAAAYVMVHPKQCGVRFLHLGLSLVCQSRTVRLRQSNRAEGRIETLLAVLALAGPEGLTESDCFARTYGFAYARAIHRGVFDVLVHRARGAVGDSAHVERGSGKLILDVKQPLIVPDPRMSQRMTDRVLRLLAERRTASAKEAAVELKVSLRAVQGALNELAKADACIARRSGRHIAYTVEDTVFSEPTGRLRKDQLEANTNRYV